MSAGLEALARELPAEWLVQQPAGELDGVPISATLTPPDGEGLARCVTALARHRLAAVPRGGGRHLSLGNPPARADLFLSTLALSGLVDFEPAEGVCRARSGTPLSALRRPVEAEGWQLPLEGPADATLGGALAAASVGPRTHGFGPARDAVLGLEVVLGSGERTRCGGRVVKNVTGYDLAKLYTGSLGSLCVIEAAWLRLRPRPETTRLLAREIEDPAEACALALFAARRPSARACALLDGHALRVELAGDGAAVAEDAAAIGGEDADEGELRAVAARQWDRPAPGVARYRIAVLASELAPVNRALLDAGARVLAYPGPGLVYATAAESQSLAEVLSAMAGRASGPLRCEAASAQWKRGRDVFHARDEELRLFRALKERFDPASVLSPGRFAGAL